MRLVVALALALSPAAASAQPVSTAPLAAREVLLEIDAVGTVRTPADRAVLIVPLEASAATTAEARAALAALEARLVAAARGAGVAPEDIGEGHDQGLFGITGNEARARAIMQVAETPPVARKRIEVRIADRARIAAVRDALEAAGVSQVADPIYVLTDDSAARQSARDQGLVRARAQAEAYARALTMRVGRILRISERATVESAQVEMMQTMMRRMMGEGSSDPEIETQVRVAVDFALVP